MLHTFAFALLVVTQARSSAGPPKFEDAQQIHWERSLDDALAIQKAENRPILLVVNADGESASERIVRERYRDPQFVAMTRGFVCVVASWFRHTPRDYDDEGHRILCPRLGGVTCGEHIALEPITHDAYLKGITIELFGETTERVSPRHVLIQPDGSKSFDEYLLFDFRDLDKQLAEWGPKAPRPNPDANPRSNRARTAFESSLIGERDLRQAWARLVEHTRAANDVGWIDAFRYFLAHGSALDDVRRSGDITAVSNPMTGTEFAELVAATGTQAQIATALRDQLSAVGRLPGVPGARDDARCLSMLGRVARNEPGTRSLLLSYLGIATKSERASVANHLADADLAKTEEVVRSLASRIWPLDPVELFERMRRSPVAPTFAPKADPPLPAAVQLEGELAEADARASKDRSDVDAQGALGLAALQLARKRAQENGPGIDLLLEDARVALAAASKAKPNDVALHCARAHAANMLSKFDEQEQAALQAVEAAGLKLDDSVQTIDHQAAEALRWLGDACARRLPERAGKDPAEEALGMLRGARSFAMVAASDDANETDWLSLASFFGALGRSRERIAFALEGVRRFPTDQALRTEAMGALWRVGRPELVVTNYEWIARANPSDAASQWYAGYALVLYAEQLRRGEDPLGAIDAYARSAPHFARAIELEPNFRDSSEHYLAMSALGRGFANLLADRRTDASKCVVEAAAIRPAAMQVRDGLDREGVDLIDGVLEWHSIGSAAPDPIAWVDALQRANPGNAFWARSISDSELREGYRASGRSDDAAAARYFDAAIASAREAHAIDPSDQNVHALAQALTAQAERSLELAQPDLERIRVLLDESAQLLGVAQLAAGASQPELAQLAKDLRASLGAARPVFRPGR